MTTAIPFSRQNNAGSRARTTQYWENLVPVFPGASTQASCRRRDLGTRLSIPFPELLKLYFKSFAYPWIDQREEDEGRPEMLLERGLVPEYDGEQRKFKKAAVFSP